MTITRRLNRLAVRSAYFWRWVVDPRDHDEIEWRAFAP